MGTSHHEPMARNHQEWARKRKQYGVWDYATNQKVLDRFFREGIERVKDTEDLITIGMRGDGDAPMGGKEGADHEYVNRDEYNMNLLKKVIKNQRRIIKDVTGRPADERPQVWAIYKEVQRFYDMGLRVPDDVIMLSAQCGRTQTSRRMGHVLSCGLCRCAEKFKMVECDSHTEHVGAVAVDV